MNKRNKMQGVKLMKVEVDTEVQYLNYEGWHCRGIATYRIGLHKRKASFMYAEETPYKIAYLDEWGSQTPSDRLQNEALLVLIYGEIGKFKYRQEQIQRFREKREKEEKERQEQEELDRKKRIALGEQVSIEKYLLNKNN